MEWIKTEDRLPQDNEMVLVSGPLENDYRKGRYMSVAEFFNGAFCDVDTGDDYFWPSHWMPLPAHPTNDA